MTMVEGLDDETDLNSVAQQLPRRARQQVGAADDLGDLHGVVVGHDGQFVGGEVVAPPDDEVAEVRARDAPHAALEGIVELDHATVRHAKPPGDAAWSACAIPAGRPQARREDRLVWFVVGGALVRRDGGFFHVAARVGARVDHARGLEAAPHVEIPRRPLALPIRPVRAAHVGAFGPREAQPAEVVERGGGKLLAAARAVEVFDPHHEAGGAGTGGGPGEGLGVAHVEQARGRGREPAAEPAHTSHHSPVMST